MHSATPSDRHDKRDAASEMHGKPIGGGSASGASGSEMVALMGLPPVQGGGLDELDAALSEGGRRGEVDREV